MGKHVEKPLKLEGSFLHLHVKKILSNVFYAAGAAPGPLIVGTDLD
jgi:hypothetical protein